MADSILVSRQLNTLLSGAESHGPVCSGEVVDCSLYLLQNVPATRQAVLEYLSLVFEEAASAHLKADARLQGTNCDYEGLIGQIRDVLQTYIRRNPQIWTPALSQWSIELLGQISTKLRHSGHQSPSLNEQLQQWMTCPPTNTLIQIASDCLDAMVGSTPEVCVDALLEASVKYAPHFDWVVAHIGSCFPQTVIQRVLLVGLGEYHGYMSQHKSGDPAKIPKIHSVVGILAHLANHHTSDLNQALVALFQDGLKTDGGKMYQSVVGFLLRIAHMSPVLLQSIASNATDVLSPTVVNRLCLDLSHHPLGSNSTTLTNLVVQLLRKCNQHAYSIIQLLFNIASPTLATSDAMETDDVVGPVAQETCALIINWLLLDLQRCVHRQGSEGGVEVPFLRGLMSHTLLLTKQLATATGDRSLWLSRLMACVGLHSTTHDAALILSSLIICAANTKQLDLVMSLHQELCIRYPGVFQTALTQVVGQLVVTTLTPDDKTRVLDNLIHLTEWEKLRDTRFSGYSIVSGLHEHLSELSHLLVESCSNSVLRLLCTLGLPATYNLEAATMLQQNLTTSFFTTLTIHDRNEKFSQSMGCIESLQMLCTAPCLQTAVVRNLLEVSLTTEYRELFGGKHEEKIVTPAPTLSLSGSLRQTNVKLKENCLTPTRPTGLHNGIIGRGVKPAPKPQILSQEELDDNKQLLVDALWSCCTTTPQTAPSPGKHSQPNSPAGSNSRSNSPKPHSKPGSRCSSPVPSSHPSPVPGENRPRRGVIPAEVGRDLGVVLVELITPDVMYNGILWPEEDFMKATTERDLMIKKKFDDNPVLWQLLELLAHSPGALCYCSVLMRSLMATLVSHWETSRHAAARMSPKYLHVSCKLISLLRQAGMLAPPLCHIGELLQYLTPFEIHLLLLAVWKYMKENPPDPRIQRRDVCAGHYTEVLRYIFISNISSIGHLYPRVFSNKM